MILAGEEFADQHDRFDSNGNVTQDGGKQVDPVDYSRLQDAWRQRVVEYVSRLVKARTSIPALATNDTSFIHTDFNGKRLLVWRRGSANQIPVVVIANFSDFTSDGGLNGTYQVPNWPATPPGKQWKEITLDRHVPTDKVGNEPIFSWEAKVYTLV
jgi:glycosidase